VKPRNDSHVKYNQLITRALSDAKEYILDFHVRNIPIDPQVYLRGSEKGQDVIERLEFKMHECKNFRTAAKYKTCIRRIREAKMNLPIQHVTVSWIKKLEDVLYSLGNNQNTRTKYLKAVGTIFTEAKQSGEITYNPFDGYRKSSSPGKKAKLSRDEFKSIQETRLEGPQDQVRNMWVFAALARGMRAYDVLTLSWDNIKDGRLQYRAQKSPFGKEGKEFDIKVTPAMEDCLALCNRSGTFVFPFVRELPGKLA